MRRSSVSSGKLTFVLLGVKLLDLLLVMLRRSSLLRERGEKDRLREGDRKSGVIERVRSLPRDGDLDLAGIVLVY